MPSQRGSGSLEEAIRRPENKDMISEQTVPFSLRDLLFRQKQLSSANGTETDSKTAGAQIKPDFDNDDLKILETSDDIINTIAESIRSKSWLIGSKKEVNEARKQRDRSLAALARVSKESYFLWNPILLKHLTITARYMKQVEKILINKPEVAKMIKSLHVVNDANVGETEIMAEGVDLDFLLSQMEMPPGKTIVSTADFRNKPKSIYSRLDSLETLVLEDPRMIGFLNDKRIPFSFLDNLKRLQIYPRQEKLPARGGIWLLSFCKNLKSASLNLSVGREDYRFLKDYSEMFKGLSSVSQLAVEFEMVKGGGYAPPWWVEEEQRSFKGKGGTPKSQAILLFLLVTKNLDSLELLGGLDPMNQQGQRKVLSLCLHGLEASFHSLKHLRYLCTDRVFPQDELFDFSLLRNLKILCIDRAFFGSLLQDGRNKRESRHLLPSSLETIQMPYYAFDPNSVNSWDFEEEIAFSNYLKDRSLPNLKTVAVPFGPYDIFNETSRQSQHKRMWLKARKVLLEEVDRRGVKLRELKHWEQVGDPAKDEDCITTRSWLAFPHYM